MHIITISYRSTNYFILDNGKAKLLVDAGWPGTLGEFKHALKRMDISLADINYLLVTHYHPDHAGLAQDVKDAGAKLIITEEQVPFIPRLKEYIKPGTIFNDIRPDANILISIQNSRAFFKKLGFDARIMHTPGHSDDSVSLLLDSGEAFIGDLAPAYAAGDNALVKNSWEKLKGAGAKKIYPSHANTFLL